MPVIPTNEGQIAISGRTPGLSEASADAFGAAPARAYSQLAGAVGDAGNAINAIHQKKTALEADRYANESMKDLTDYYSKWSADNKNNSREDYADQFQALALKSRTDYEQKAPNKEARRQFRER